ncbi:alpha/beta hydrolase-fold protein [Actinoplanes couchii]|uniref:Enterochelin esterase N-terminal domain-containing protein n=1 Tax=Actinoplanes couchii TaxID=403638 RepID=A0ABQ3XFL0_9ACTN|nr:alpha/beta hydrolase-fold protein [Actinoplanes couchii]MDR6321749.1 enterochelin esterase family protein [Actinoplanes couchii]GID57294.1 hypothetical protein Aco03nite_056980 [Actinoplanes couchii]
MGIIDRLAADPSLWTEITAAGLPVIEPRDDGQCLVTFLWRGEAERTHVHWGLWDDLTRLPGTDIWHLTRVLPADLRTVYYLSHDAGFSAPPDRAGTGTWHVDPGNPRHVHFPADPVDPADKDGWVSLLELPAAPAEPWLDQPRSADLERAVIHSRALGGDRHLTLHQPGPGRPVLVVFDGHNAQKVLRIPETVQNLTAAGRIPPLTTIFVHLPDDTRDDHLAAVPEMREFLAGELMPWAPTHVGALLDGGRNVIAGASRGGLAAVWGALELPGLFGAAIAQSGSFWWAPPGEDPEWLTRRVAAAPATRGRFYLDVGTMETQPLPGGTTMIEVGRRMRDTLRAHGHRVHWSEYTGSHDYVNWRRTFADALLAVTP